MNVLNGFQGSKASQSSTSSHALASLTTSRNRRLPPSQPPLKLRDEGVDGDGELQGAWMLGEAEEEVEGHPRQSS